MMGSKVRRVRSKLHMMRSKVRGMLTPPGLPEGEVVGCSCCFFIVFYALLLLLSFACRFWWHYGAYKYDWGYLPAILLWCVFCRECRVVFCTWRGYKL